MAHDPLQIERTRGAMAVDDVRPACPAGRPPASAGPVPETPRTPGPVRAEVLHQVLLAQAKEALARGEECSDPIIKAQEFHDAGESLVILAREIALADRRRKKEGLVRGR